VRGAKDNYDLRKSVKDMCTDKSNWGLPGPIAAALDGIKRALPKTQPTYRVGDTILTCRSSRSRNKGALKLRN
jgi:hypothetical protein